MNPAASPEPVEDVQGDNRWMCMHQRFSARANEREPEVLFVGDDFAERLVATEHDRFLSDTKEAEPEVVFIGDTFIQQLANTELWEKMFVPLHCLNFGIGGDQTQHVLWRIQNGELENFSPKVIVLLAGTNNYDHSADQVAEGVLEIVKTTETKQPSAQVIVMGIPPRGQRPNPLREKIAAINKTLSEKLQPKKNVQFLNVDPSLFVQKDGLINHRDMYDYLHLTSAGYQKLCEPLLEEVQNLLKTYVKVESTSGEPSEN